MSHLKFVDEGHFENIRWNRRQSFKGKEYVRIGEGWVSVHALKCAIRDAAGVSVDDIALDFNQSAQKSKRKCEGKTYCPSERRMVPCYREDYLRGRVCLYTGSIKVHVPSASVNPMTVTNVTHVRVCGYRQRVETIETDPHFNNVFHFSITPDGRFSGYMQYPCGAAREWISRADREALARDRAQKRLEKAQQSKPWMSEKKMRHLKRRAAIK